MELFHAALSALTNLVLFAGLPFLGFFVFHKWRHKRGLAEIAQRAGLRLGEGRYIGYSALYAAATVAVLVLWPPAVEPMVREGSPWKNFVGLGFGGE